jgi:predicted HicB family RNase H-like nuclease
MIQYALRIPGSLEGYAKELAREVNVSLKQFIVMALAEKVSALKTEAFFRERA